MANKMVQSGRPQVGPRTPVQKYPVNPRSTPNVQSLAVRSFADREGESAETPPPPTVEAQSPVPAKMSKRKIMVGQGAKAEEFVVKKGWVPPPTLFRKGWSLILWQLEPDEYVDTDDTMGAMKQAVKKIDDMLVQRKEPEREYKCFKCPSLTEEEVAAGEEQKQWRFYRVS